MLEHKNIKPSYVEIDSKLNKKLDHISESFPFFPSATPTQVDMREFNSSPILDLSITLTQAHALWEKSHYWSDKVKAEFKQTIHVQPHQHSARRIYYHFKQRARRIKPNCDYHLHYLEKIAIFQSSLSDEQLKIHDLSYCLKAAAHVGNIALVQWFMSVERGKNRVIPDQQVLKNAACSGNLALVQWLTSPERGALRLQPTWEVLAEAAGSGNTELVQWLYQLEINYIDPLVDVPSTILSHAARSGNLALVQWLISPDRGESRIQPTSDTLNAAAESGNLTMVEWLMSPDRGIEQLFPTEQITARAAESGNIRLLQQLMPPIRSFPLDCYYYNPTLTWAAHSGNLEMIKWLMSENRESLRLIPDIGTLKAAARNGHLHIVQYLMSAKRGRQQINPTINVLNAAIASGNLELVEWLTAPERGTQRLLPDKKSLHIGLKTGNFIMVKRLISPERSSPISIDYLQMIMAAADGSNNDRFFFQLLMSPTMGSHKINPDLFLSFLARNGNLEWVQWIISYCNATPTQDTIRRAALSGNVELVLWLTSAECGDNQVIPRQVTIDFIKSLRNPELTTLCQQMEKILQSKARRKTVLSGLNSKLGARSFLWTASQKSSFDPQVLRNVFNFSGDPLPSITQRAQRVTAVGMKTTISSSSIKQSEADLPEAHDVINFSSKPWF